MSNTSVQHEAPLEVLRLEPRAVLDLLGLVGFALPAGPLDVAPVDSELTEAVPSHHAADFIALVYAGQGEARRAVLAVIVEVQREPDPQKRFVWPLYAAQVRAQRRVPVVLCVVTFSRRVARWAAQPIEEGPNATFTPLVIGPDKIRAIPSVEAAVVDPELATLVMLVRLAEGDAVSAKRGKQLEAELERVCKALLRVPDKRKRDLYMNLIYATASSQFRTTMEAFLEAYGMGIMELMKKEGFEEGHAQGEARGEARGKLLGEAQGKLQGKLQGEADALLRILARRGLGLSAEHEARVRSSTDLAEIERWIDRALEAKSAEEVFEG